MGKVAVIIYITVAVLVLFLISYSPRRKSDHHLHPRIALRSSFNFKPKHHAPVLFDPLVADIQRRREDKEWERKYFEDAHPEIVSRSQQASGGGDHGNPAPGHESRPEWEDFMDAEDYLNDEDKFNVTGRLILMFPKIDVAPRDGFVTETELINWNMQSSEKEVMHRTQREMDVHDRNKDGFISFSEYQPPSWVRNAAVDNDSFVYEMGWWKEEHFNAADADGDGMLNITEFNDFLHPADTKNPKLLMWLCKEEVRERDSDKSGNISFEEFFQGLFETLRSYEEENDNSSHPIDELLKSPAKQLFDQFDNDGDDYLSDVELLPVITKIHPTESYYAKQQADYIISQVDLDKDRRLTLAEMIEHPYVFYSAIFNEEDDNYGFHDEFR